MKIGGHVTVYTTQDTVTQVSQLRHVDIERHKFVDYIYTEMYSKFT